MERTAGNQMTVKENNQQLIIDTLVKHQATSRAELAKMLKLSAPSVSKNITPLLEKKILREIGEGDSIGGRRPILLEFNYNYGYIIGVDLSGQDLRIALGNLRGEIIELRIVDISNVKKGSKILDILIENISGILEKNSIKPKQLLAIALGFPGVVSGQTYQLITLSFWRYIWDGLDIKEELKKKFKVEVIIKNDTNLAALGECSYGVGKNYRNLVYVSADMGVGAGIVLDNKLYEGTNLAAGELGYFASNRNDLNLNNQYVGPLESRIAIPGLIERIKRLVSQGKASKITELAHGDTDQIDVKAIEDAIRLKDPLIIQEMEEIATELGIVLANIGILLDLELIILGGKLFNMGYDFLKPLNEIMGKITPVHTRVIYSSLEQNAIIYGAFSTALEYIYNNILKI